MPVVASTLGGGLVTAELGGVPVWLVLVMLVLSGAAMVVALWGRPMKSHPFGTDEDEIAIVQEVHGVDRVLSAHSNGVLTLIALAGAGFATTIKAEGGPGAPLIFATIVALVTSGSIAAVGFALEGGATGAATLSSSDLRERVNHDLRRVHRRTQLVRSATWCLFPTIVLVVICGVVAKT
ncbi:MAG: hypothetical protein ACRDO2_12115 [Nocardioidaceae bacterium]